MKAGNIEYIKVNNNRYKSNLRHIENKNRRTRQLRRRVLYTMLAFVVGILISIVGFGSNAKAESSDYVTTYKYYKSITVNNDDTLWNIAVMYSNDSNYDKYINEVKHINHLSGTEIMNGMSLIIPYYSTEFIS